MEHENTLVTHNQEAYKKLLNKTDINCRGIDVELQYHEAEDKIEIIFHGLLSPTTVILNNNGWEIR